ncbi:hypothetical protein GCM10010525_02520 [Glutamicibacter bergerei]
MMPHEEETLVFVQKRRGQEKTDLEISRCIKRYLAPRAFRILGASVSMQEAQLAA